ncbi:hypothetical protein FOA52_008868 [Chlamydomonas sp. UWO 241]|nr:hypothetical protein FOA52_008868 [Chlamydomonas sp. UWO 241]
MPHAEPKMSLVKPHDFVVCVQRVGTDVVVKILAVDALGKKATGVCEGNFAQLPGVYAANGNPMRASDADATQDSIRRPQGLISSPSMAPQH